MKIIFLILTFFLLGVGEGPNEVLWPDFGRVIFSAAFIGNDAGTIVNNQEYVQLQLDALEYTDPTGFFEVNIEKDLICNTSNRVLSNIECSSDVNITISGMGSGNSSFLVKLGKCIGCQTTTFPQLDNGDINLDYATRVVFSVLISSVSVPLNGIIVMNPGECIGLMALAESQLGDGKTLTVTAGTINLHITK